MKTLKGLWFNGIVSPLRLRLFVWLSLVTQILIVVTGGAVRLTGSGLGCPTWPKCTEDSLISTPEMGFHGVIEFGNGQIYGDIHIKMMKFTQKSHQCLADVPLTPLYLLFHIFVFKK